MDVERLFFVLAGVFGLLSIVFMTGHFIYKAENDNKENPVLHSFWLGTLVVEMVCLAVGWVL